MLLDAAKIQNNSYLKNFSLTKNTELYPFLPHLIFINYQKYPSLIKKP
mgnify:FL=1